MKTAQHVIVEMDPYETGQLLNVIGPFGSREEASDARKAILKRGGHPDSEWTVLPIQALNAALDSLEPVEGE